ncbi:MAG: rhomboid family intramembrane serine protease [Bacteroidia bacterium]
MENEGKHILRQLWLPSTLVAVMWLVFGAESLFDYDLSQWGILPRRMSGLPGILISPFLHGSFEHLGSNTLPIFFLTLGLFVSYRKIAWQVFITSWVGTGIFVWIAARSSYHIGASGVIYALIFFLFFSGVFRKEVQAIGIALIVALFYGGAIWGIFPGQPGVSWESHAFGALTGTVIAFFFRKSGPERKKYEWEDETDEEDPSDAVQPWNIRSLYPPPEGFQYPEK